MKKCPNCGISLRVAISLTATKQKLSSQKLKEPRPFVSDDEIQVLLEDKRFDLQIIGTFFKFRGDIFLSKEELSDAIKANVRAAKVLASTKFKLEFYHDLFAYTEKKMAEIQKTKEGFITNLTTTTKFLQQFRKEYPGYEQTRD